MKISHRDALLTFIKNAHLRPKLYKYKDLYFVVKPPKQKLYFLIQEATDKYLDFKLQPIDSRYTDRITPTVGYSVLDGLVNGREPAWKLSTSPRKELILYQEALLYDALLYPSYEYVNNLQAGYANAIILALLNNPWFTKEDSRWAEKSEEANAVILLNRFLGSHLFDIGSIDSSQYGRAVSLANNIAKAMTEKQNPTTKSKVLGQRGMQDITFPEAPDVYDKGNFESFDAMNAAMMGL